MTGELIYRKAKIDDANAITKFCLDVIRHSFTKRQKIGPQEYLLSNEHEIDYLKIRHKSLNLSTTITKIAIDLQFDQIIGYIEFGPKNTYFNDLNCTHEILCYFVNPDHQGKGIGKYLLASVMQEAHDGGTFFIGKDNVGVLTMQGNQTITLYYEKSLGMVVAKTAEISRGPSPLSILPVAYLIWDAHLVENFLNSYSSQEKDQRNQSNNLTGKINPENLVSDPSLGSK